MSKSSTAITQTWARAAANVARHQRDYVIEVMRAIAQQEGKPADKSGAKVKKPSATTADK